MTFMTKSLEKLWKKLKSEDHKNQVVLFKLKTFLTLPSPSKSQLYNFFLLLLLIILQKKKRKRNKKRRVLKRRRNKCCSSSSSRCLNLKMRLQNRQAHSNYQLQFSTQNNLLSLSVLQKKKINWKKCNKSSQFWLTNKRINSRRLNN